MNKEGILKSIGNTPLLLLASDSQTALIFAKAEFLNPGGSVKDRIALAMIEDAEREGILKSGATVIEPSSGNTGIGLAMVCAVKGYRCIITMPETMSLERVYILESYGAKVVLTKASEGMAGAIRKAQELAKKEKTIFFPHQFENQANVRIHRETTAKEILRQVNGQIDAFVAGVGTGGTITGVGEVLKEYNPAVKIFAVEPAKSPVLSGGKAGQHRIQGIGAGFVPAIINRKIIDEVICVSDDDAYQEAKKLASQEGILCGISSGAALFASKKVARQFGPGKTIVTVFPDRGERYFSVNQYFEF